MPVRASLFFIPVFPFGSFYAHISQLAILIVISLHITIIVLFSRYVHPDIDLM
ncbi:hypothetical protein K450DRAFT_253432 [Umbelopsis ramanniana AG]|uniref:Uncharacterized protein n=1 Tax=Umbelopsis ramanniana AG TaxID=1314678 RepID=A0AAD5E5Q1_UMBRA|nr:uncharacterized protein K450DRAFT_253432 [Umbelopsis ramanniana AG]KAI8577212.1 hypothetical protein K450DRAFT_253432 [Umbelopsis ramanniana AG]